MDINSDDKDNQLKINQSNDDIQEDKPVISVNGLEYYSYGENPQKEKIRSVSFSKQSKKIMMDAVSACLIGVVVILLISLFRTRDMTVYLSSPEDEFLRKAGKRNILCEEMKRKVPQYADGAEIEVYGDKGVYTIHMDGKYEGVHIADKHYSLYGIKIGSDETFLLQNMTYEYDGKNKKLFQSFDDTSWYYYFENSNYNDCLFVFVDYASNKVVSVTYHKNRKKATETLNFNSY